MMNLPMPEYGNNDKETINNLMDTVMKLRKELEFVLHHLDDENIPSLAGIKGDIKSNYTKIEQTDSAIVLMASDVSGNKAAIEVNSDRIGLVVSDVDGNKTAIEANSSSINLKANQTTVDNLTGRVASAESSIDINASGISSKVSKTDYNGNTITSMINQSETTVDIDARRINLWGITSVANTVYIGSGSSHGTIFLRNGVSIKSTDEYSTGNMILFDAESLWCPTIYMNGNRVATMDDVGGGGTSGEDRTITVGGDGVWHELRIRDGLIKDIDDIPM